MNILIVDDEYYLVQSIVKDLDWKSLNITSVFTAFSAMQAQEIFQKEKIDILLTDIEMPQMNGLDLIIWANEQNYHPVSLILTGHQRFDYARQAIKLHCFGYILKPAPTNVLEEEIRSSCEAVNLDTEDIPDGGSDFLTTVQNLIAKNLGNPELNRAFLANEIHMNADYISYLFHKENGQSLITYISNERLALAKKLLSTTSLSIQEVSEKSGYANVSYFHKQFKKAFGITPQQHRDIHHV